MDLREIVNSGLARTTGYRLTKAPAAHPAAAAKPPVRRRKALPAFYDEPAKEIIRRVKPWTMTNHTRLYALIIATRYVADHRIPGDYVECGVWRGGSTQAAALTLMERGDTSRDLHLFDTFEGMPPPGEKDVDHTGRSAEERLATSERTSAVWAIAGLDDVRDGMSQIGYPSERIHFHPGLVEDTIPAQAPEDIAILRLDTDWYESTRHELEHLYDRVPSGGVILFDDYGYWQGAGQAVDEFLERTGERLLLVPMASGRIAVKP
jgi:O-methyltransferase